MSRSAMSGLPLASRTSMRYRPLISALAMSVATVFFPSPASRSTQVRTRKWVPLSFCCAEELINVAFAVADMHAPPRISQRCGGLPQVLQPYALLALYRNARWVDLLLQCCRSLELFPVPELDGRQAERQTFSRQC